MDDLYKIECFPCPAFEEAFKAHRWVGKYEEVNGKCPLCNRYGLLLGAKLTPKQVRAYLESLADEGGEFN